MAKYDGLRKLERNRMVVVYKEQHPDLSMEEIGAVFNISRSRVSQLLRKAAKGGEKAVAQTG